MTIISNAQARRIASEWHDGQNSPLYALTSSGYIEHYDDGEQPDVEYEIVQALAQHQNGDGDSYGRDVAELLCLLAYVRRVGPRDVDDVTIGGWSDAWDDSTVNVPQVEHAIGACDDVLQGHEDMGRAAVSFARRQALMTLGPALAGTEDDEPDHDAFDDGAVERECPSSPPEREWTGSCHVLPEAMRLMAELIVADGSRLTMRDVRVSLLEWADAVEQLYQLKPKAVQTPVAATETAPDTAAGEFDRDAWQKAMNAACAAEGEAGQGCSICAEPITSHRGAAIDGHEFTTASDDAAYACDGCGESDPYRCECGELQRAAGALAVCQQLAADRGAEQLAEHRILLQAFELDRHSADQLQLRLRRWIHATADLTCPLDQRLQLSIDTAGALLVTDTASGQRFGRIALP